MSPQISHEQNFCDSNLNEEINLIEYGILRDILKGYVDIFAKHKYDVG